MIDTDQEDSWYKHCASCRQWRVTNMQHCWQCGEVLGPPYMLEDVMKSKQSALIDTTQTHPIKRLWQRAREHGYEHDQFAFIMFFEELNGRIK